MNWKYLHHILSHEKKFSITVPGFDCVYFWTCVNLGILYILIASNPLLFCTMSSPRLKLLTSWTEVVPRINIISTRPLLYLFWNFRTICFNTTKEWIEAKVLLTVCWLTQYYWSLLLVALRIRRRTEGLLN